MTLNSREQKVISVKVPADLLEWLKSQSALGYRSMSRHVVLVLEEARKAGLKSENAPTAVTAGAPN